MRSVLPIGVILFFVLGVSQLVTVHLLGAGEPVIGVLWVAIGLGAAIQWLRLRQRNPDIADQMGGTVAALFMALARVLST